MRCCCCCCCLSYITYNVEKILLTHVLLHFCRYNIQYIHFFFESNNKNVSSTHTRCHYHGFFRAFLLHILWRWSLRNEKKFLNRYFLWDTKKISSVSYNSRTISLFSNFPRRKKNESKTFIYCLSLLIIFPKIYGFLFYDDRVKYTCIHKRPTTDPFYERLH